MENDTVFSEGTMGYLWGAMVLATPYTTKRSYTRT